MVRVKSLSQDSEKLFQALVLGWIQRAGGQPQPFTAYDRFLSLWIAFEAWFTKMSKYEIRTSRSRDRIGWVKDKSGLKEAFAACCKSPEYCETVKKAASEPVWNTLCGDWTEISDDGDWGKVVEWVYQVRNNLVHGEKLFLDQEEARDHMLVKLAGKVLEPVFVRRLKQMKWPIQEGKSARL